MNTFVRVCSEYLTHKQKRDALRAITLIKEKRSEKIKGGSRADGRAQREYITKQEVAALNVSMDELPEKSIIDVFEEHAMAKFDVPDAYLNADVPEDKFVWLRLEYEFVDIICEVNPEFTKDVKQEFRKKVLYLRVLK